MSTWMTTCRGRSPDLARFTAADVHIEEIAFALAQINRFNGHTSRPYSVAEHSVYVARLAELDGASPSLQLAALLHDAHEAYIGDITSPVKAALGVRFAEFEERIALTTRRALRVSTAWVTGMPFIHGWDMRALATERRDLLPAGETEWPCLRGVEPGPWPIDRFPDHSESYGWASAFLAHYHALLERIATQRADLFNINPKP